MNLNQLVNLRNQLRQTLDTSIIQSEIEKNCMRLQMVSQDSDSSFSDLINNAANIHKTNFQYFVEDTKNIQSIIDLVQNKINELSAKFFAENYELELNYYDVESIRSKRILQQSEEFEQILTQRINLYSNWQYPALEIGCRDGKWTKLLVASDPLYIADYFQEFLNSAVIQFPELYQGRVRKYLIKDFTEIPDLPINQFGLIFSYNFFNYLSFDSIKQLLTQAQKYLRPGGRIIFTYNNADLPAGAAYAEGFWMSYVPKSLLVPMAESIGFETVYSFDTEPAFSMIELKKVGDLKTIKLSQTLGEIQIKNN